MTSCLVWATLGTAPSLAEPPKALGDEHVFETWQREDGLPQISVNAIAQDDHGYLWVGTDDGLARFDGLSFTVFNQRRTPGLPSNAIRALASDGDGGLWVATRRGLAHHAGGSFRSHAADGGADLDRLLALARDRAGRLWIGSESGLHRLENGVVTSYTPRDGLAHDAVWTVLEDRRGGLWVGTEGGLHHLEEGRVSATYTTRDGLPHDHVRALLEDRRGRLWIGTSDGLARLEGDRIDVFSSADGLAHPVVIALLEDRDGRLWVGTETGLTRLQEGDLASFRLTTSTERSGNRVSALWEDHEGSLWLGTGLLGLARIRRAQFSSLDVSGGLPDDLVWVIYQDRSGAVWVGTNSGLARRDPDGSLTSYTVADGLPGPDVRSLLGDRRGHLWIGTDRDGLARLANGRFERYGRRHGLTGDGVFVLLEDRAGALWIGTDRGLNRLIDGRFEAISTRRDLAGDRVWALHEDPQGNIWIGTEGGLARWSEGRVAAVALPVRDIVKALHGDTDGTLWIATAANGLLRYRGGSFTAFSTDDGLFDQLIHQILDDGLGRLWMSSNQGIFRVDRHELEDFTAGRIPAVVSIAYREEHGLRSRECNGDGHPAGVRTSDGRLWFPTIKGVAITDPARLESNQVPPPVHIERILADRVPVATGDGAVATPAKEAVLPPLTREIEFQFAALSFLNPDKLLFKYKLEGFDRQWSAVTTRRSATYTNLSPGTYHFRVKAANSDGLWNKTGDTVDLYLRPAIHQTATFRGAAVLALLAAGWGLYKLRIRRLVAHTRELLRMKEELETKNAEIRASHEQVRSRNEEIEAKSAELERFTYTVSHDLKSPLVTIRGFLGMIRKDLESGRSDRLPDDLDRIDGAAARMTRLLDELLELSRIGRIVNAPEEVSFSELAREAAELVAGRINERGVDVEIDTDAPTIVGDRPRLLEVLQNLIDNAVKFLGEQPGPQIRVGSRREGTEDVFFVRDNGIGIDPRYHEKVFELFDRLDQNVEGTGIGLALVKRIVEFHGGRVWIESRGAGQGSTFCFTVPAPKTSMK